MNNYQLTHKEEWTQQNAPLFWIEMIYRGDTKELKRIFNHPYNGHYFVSRNQVTTFYSNTKASVKIAKEATSKYTNIIFIKKILRRSVELEKKLNTISNKLNKNLSTKRNKELFILLSDYYDIYSSFIGLYRSTRPTFYQGAVESVRKIIPSPKDKNLALLIKNKFDKLSFKISSHLRDLLIAFKSVGERRFEMHDVYLKNFIKSRRLFSEIGQRCGLSVKEAQNCTLAELRQYLLKQKTVNREEIRNRLGYFKFIYHDGFFEVQCQPDKASDHSLFTGTLYGQVANPGYAKGTVRVIKESLSGISRKELNRMKKGEVLVTTSTSPDMMIAIKKAVAIITDVGGLLSHAAIVSRELEIPCVIGTQNATKVLKDGDVVEIDATRGMVRRI
ncbi:MAG: PEP-utilizing enzyme [Patescibacteria group bacterium]